MHYEGTMPSFRRQIYGKFLIKANFGAIFNLMSFIISTFEDHGVGSEVNPESWTQLKGSNEKGI